MPCRLLTHGPLTQHHSLSRQILRVHHLLQQVLLFKFSDKCFYLFDSIRSRVFSQRQKNVFIIQSSCHNIIKFSSIQDKETTNYLCFINLCNILSSFFDCSSAPPLLCCLHTNQCSILVTRYCNDLRILGLMSNFKFCCLLNQF